MTNKLLEFFDDPLTRLYRVDVFNKFVRDFEGKLNQLRLVEMGVKVSKEIDSESSSFFRSISYGRTGNFPFTHSRLLVR